jgi:hypothetical protein
LGDNIIDDYTFDMWAKELVELQERYPKESREARFHDAFENFDGSSGFDLPYSMPDIQAIGNRLLRNRER